MMEKADFYTETSGGATSTSAYWVYAGDGVRLRVGLWQAENVSNGSVLLFPGRTDYIEQYGRVADELVKYGYSTLVIDWRGQGLADRVTEDPRTGHVKRFADYQKDVAAMLNAAKDLGLPKPWHLIGHSMGGCIGLRALMEGLPVAACAFTAPMWDIHISPVERLAALPLTWAAQALGKGHIYAPGYSGQTYVLRAGFEGNTLTNDPEMYQHWVNLAKNLPDRQTGGPSMGWLYQSLREMRSLSRMTSPDIPCISFCGTQDHIVGIAAIHDRMNRWPGGIYKVIDNAKHELLLEMPTVRQSVMAEICDLFGAVKQGSNA